MCHPSPITICARLMETFANIERSMNMIYATIAVYCFFERTWCKTCEPREKEHKLQSYTSEVSDSQVLKLLNSADIDYYCMKDLTSSTLAQNCEVPTLHARTKNRCLQHFQKANFLIKNQLRTPKSVDTTWLCSQRMPLDLGWSNRGVSLFCLNFYKQRCPEQINAGLNKQVHQQYQLLGSAEKVRILEYLLEARRTVAHLFSSDISEWSEVGSKSTWSQEKTAVFRFPQVVHALQNSSY